jgi:hypothetical protein
LPITRSLLPTGRRRRVWRTCLLLRLRLRLRRCAALDECHGGCVSAAPPSPCAEGGRRLRRRRRLRLRLSTGVGACRQRPRPVRRACRLLLLRLLSTGVGACRQRPRPVRRACRLLLLRLLSTGVGACRQRPRPEQRACRLLRRRRRLQRCATGRRPSVILQMTLRASPRAAPPHRRPRPRLNI